MALFAWIKRNPAGDRPLGGLLVMDEAQNFAPSSHTTASTHSTLALSSQARKYGLGLVFATQSPRGLHNHIPGNATTQFYGLLNSPAQIAVAREMARVKGRPRTRYQQAAVRPVLCGAGRQCLPQDPDAVVPVQPSAQPADDRRGPRAGAARAGRALSC